MSLNKIIKDKDIIETDLILFFRLSQFSCLDYKHIRLSCKAKNGKCVTKARLKYLVENEYLKIKPIYFKIYDDNIEVYKLTKKAIKLLKKHYGDDIIVLNSKADPHDLFQAKYIIENFLDYIDSYKHEKYLQKEKC